jgi:hypothetical protein
VKRRRAADPLIPADPSDRTGTRGILRRALAEIRRRFDGLQREVLDTFGRIRILEANDASIPRTLYSLTPADLTMLSAELQQAVERWIASGREPAYSFWWSIYVAEASRLGSAQAVAALSRVSDAYKAVRTIADVINSEAYRNRLAMAQIKSYEHWTGLAASAKTELAQVIGRAVVDGKNPRAVRAEIVERLGVSRSKARQYAQTDITDTLRMTRLAEDEHAEAELGIRTGELWTSALLPTTRETHAARHGRVYTREQVREFYGRDGNRYACHCSVTTALLDADGRPILSDTLKASMRKELGAWRSGEGFSWWKKPGS